MSNTESHTLSPELIELLEIKAEMFKRDYTEHNAYVKWQEYIESHETFKDADPKVIGTFFSQPPLVDNVSNDYTEEGDVVSGNISGIM